ncbi:Spy/CpxP family protein refolding chaperone [Marinobacter sp. LN3S78]|uniref:Spy/CpxP family protein refolding chaperone n=1 Tax=Marinobacter sp. LN3S78 TaxID=3382300 RepID=UPI00387A9F4E
MNTNVITVSVLLLALTSPVVLAAETSDYTGQEQRAIKALSETEVADLLDGKGMGYAKAAELNGYPGPAHVLELGDKLNLTPSQRERTQAIFDRMQASAQALGAELVAAESALDRAFGDRSVDESTLSERVADIARIESQLRVVHLRAHLELTGLLDDHQVARYSVLRGYVDVDPHRGGHGHHQGH